MHIRAKTNCCAPSWAAGPTALCSLASCIRPKGGGCCRPLASLWWRPGTSPPTPSTCWSGCRTNNWAPPCASTYLCAAARRKGFYAEAGRLGLREPALQLEKSPTSHTEGRAGLAALLAAQPDIDAVFCSSDMLALGALTEARGRGLAGPHPS